jgi:HK97 family phage portal protein
LKWWNPATWQANEAEAEAIGPFSVSDARAASIFGGGTEWALKSPTALAAIRAISETAGNLPLHVFAVKSDGERERDRKHAGDSVLNKRANPWDGPYGLRTKLIEDAIIYGRGVAVAVRTAGKVKELHHVAPGTYEVELTGAAPAYKINQKDGSKKRYAFTDVVDVLAPGGTIASPRRVVDLARSAIGLDIAMTAYFTKLMAKGAKPTQVVTTKDGSDIAPDLWDKLKDFFKAQLRDEDSDGTLFVPGPLNWQQRQFSSVDMEFSAMHAAVKIEILKALRCPPVIAQEYGRATWSNSSEMGLLFLQSLLPWLASVEFAFTRVLLNGDDTRFLEHQVFELVKPNLVQMYAAGKTATGTSTMTVNEWRRAALNLPPIDGGDELVRQAGQSGATDNPIEPKD